MDWKGILADLRAHLPPERGRRGSLRWLETEMRARGANPASLRNIVYRDVGTPSDKAALRALLADLAREARRPLRGNTRCRCLPLPDSPLNWNCWAAARGGRTSSSWRASGRAARRG